MSTVWSAMRKAFGEEIPIVTIFGNNDNFVNYNPPKDTDPHGKEYFPWLWNLWYENQTQDHPERDAMKEAFELGGWFEYHFKDIPGLERLGILGMNTNYLSDKCKPGCYDKAEL